MEQYLHSIKAFSSSHSASAASRLEWSKSWEGTEPGQPSKGVYVFHATQCHAQQSNKPGGAGLARSHYSELGMLLLVGGAE